MAIKPRIHWAWDGMRLYPWNTTNHTVGTELDEATRLALDDDEFIASGYDPGSGLALQFADLVQLHSVKVIFIAAVSPLKVYICADDVPGNYDPVGHPETWTQILNQTYTTGYSYIEFSFSPIADAKWVLIDGEGVNIYTLQLFGEYPSPKFEFWNTGETAELNTLQIPLPMPNAPNSVDYHQYLNFKIKNTDSSAHTYSLGIYAIKTGGDTFITNYFTLAKYSDGYTKAGSITLASIAAGNFSENLRVYGDFVKNANPADGKHYFVINVTETS
jgi:hypothetical protein